MSFACIMQHHISDGRFTHLGVSPHPTLLSLTCGRRHIEFTIATQCLCCCYVRVLSLMNMTTVHSILAQSTLSDDVGLDTQASYSRHLKWSNSYTFGAFWGRVSDWISGSTGGQFMPSSGVYAIIWSSSRPVIDSDVPWLECPACNALTWS